jgi:hypothetical protein
VSNYPYVHSAGRCWDSRHLFICTNTDYSPTRNQRCNLTPILATVRLYYILQYVVFVFCPFTPTSGRPVDAGSKTLRHLSQHYYSFDPEPEQQLRPNPSHREFVPYPSACCLRLLPVYPYVHSPGRCWDPRNNIICCNTDFAFDLKRARQLRPNYCHRVFAPHSSSSCLRLLSINPYAHSLGR